MRSKDRQGGESHHNKGTGDIGSDKEVRRIPREDALEQYRQCQDEISREQWEVVYLHYGEGLSLTEVAKRVGKARSTVSKLHSYAKAAKDAYAKRMREEAYEIRRKHLDE